MKKYKGTISHAFLRPRCAKKDYHPFPFPLPRNAMPVKDWRSRPCFVMF